MFEIFFCGSTLTAILPSWLTFEWPNGWPQHNRVLELLIYLDPFLFLSIVIFDRIRILPTFGVLSSILNSVSFSCWRHLSLLSTALSPFFHLPCFLLLFLESVSSLSKITPEVIFERPFIKERCSGLVEAAENPIRLKVPLAAHSLSIPSHKCSNCFFKKCLLKWFAFIFDVLSFHFDFLSAFGLIYNPFLCTRLCVYLLRWLLFAGQPTVLNAQPCLIEFIQSIWRMDEIKTSNFLIRSNSKDKLTTLIKLIDFQKLIKLLTKWGSFDGETSSKLFDTQTHTHTRSMLVQVGTVKAKLIWWIWKWFYHQRCRTSALSDQLVARSFFSFHSN